MQASFKAKLLGEEDEAGMAVVQEDGAFGHSCIVCALPWLTRAVDPMRDAEPLPVWYVLFLRRPFVAIVVAHFCHNWSVGVLCVGHVWLSTGRGWFVIMSWLPRFFEHLGVPARMHACPPVHVCAEATQGWLGSMLSFRMC